MYGMMSLLFIIIFHISTTHSIESYQIISDTEGLFTGVLDDFDNFGTAVASIGDLDGDGVIDIAVGAPLASTGPNDYGKVWILFLNTDGTVNRTSEEITEGSGGFTGTLEDGDNFGRSIGNLGDLDGDNVTDIVVGAYASGKGGCVWILFLNTDGTVRDQQQITEGEGGLVGPLESSSRFGTSVCTIGDLDNDGVVDMAVGADFQDGEGTNRGAVWILFLNNDGTVKDQHTILDTEIAFGGTITNNYHIGTSVSTIGDFDGDEVFDLAVGGVESGNAIWILLLNMNGTVKDYYKISSETVGFLPEDGFACSITQYGDLNGDGITDLIAGANILDDEGNDMGSIWILYLNSDGTVKDYSRISNSNGIMTGLLSDSDKFGTSVSALGNFRDGNLSIVVGSPGKDDGGSTRGAVWILNLDEFAEVSTVEATLSQIIGVSDSQPLVETSDIVSSMSCIPRNMLCLYSYCVCDGNVVVFDTTTISNTSVEFNEDFKSQGSISFLEATATFTHTNAQFYQLNLSHSTIHLDLHSVINVEQTLEISDTNLIIDITKEEKEEIQKEGVILITVDGEIIGDFESITVLVDGEEDTSVVILRQSGENDFVVIRKNNTALWIILILVLVVIFVILAMLLKKTRIKKYILEYHR